GMVSRASTQARQAALEVLVEVALDAATGDVGVGGDRVVAHSMALEPEHLHLSLDPGVGVMVTVVGQVPPVIRSEGDRPHGGHSMLFPGRSPSGAYRLARPPTICARPGRAEYNIPNCPGNGVHLSRVVSDRVIRDRFPFDALRRGR